MKERKKFKSLAVFGISEIAYICLNAGSRQWLIVSIILSVGFFVFALKVGLSIQPRNTVVHAVAAGVVLFITADSFYDNMQSSSKINVVADYIGAQTSVVVAVFACVGFLVAFYSVYRCLVLITSDATFFSAKPILSRIGSFRANGMKAWLVLLIVCLIWLLPTSTHSPLYNGELPTGDASIFTMMGKAWANGLIPYKDIFDHKGPIIFFAYMIGYLIKPELGIFLFELLAIWVSVVFAYKIGCLVYGRTAGVVSVLCVLLYSTVLEFGRALTEEFNLPVLMISMYLMLRYLYAPKENTCHPPRYAFVYGIAVAVSFYLRTTNCVAVCAGVLCITAYLLANKEFLCVLKNGLAFLTGAALVLIPFAVYFYLNNALGDMLWGTFFYNFELISDPVSHSLSNLATYLFLLLPVLVVCYVCITELRETRFLPITVLVMCLLSILIVTHGKLYKHYYIILMPFIPVAVGMIFKRIQQSSRRVSFYVCMGIALLFCTPTWTTEISEATNVWINGYEISDYEEAAVKMASVIPEEDYTSVIGYNTSSLWYLYTDIMPCYKYYTLQDSQSSHSLTMQKENAEFYQSGAAKWVVVEDEIEMLEVEKAINENYILEFEIECKNRYNEDTTLRLYQLI
ncbi:MAG: glycosyltransferase family 39 protein [Clostridiaceae bacterium]|nr:glycosyltransferase family 39 protein [Clostridiaceae bacterium]